MKTTNRLKWALVTMAVASTATLCSIPVKAEPWDTETQALYVAGVALIVADWAQTRDIATRVRPDGSKVWRETNPLLPDYPRMHEVNRHFIGALVLHYGLTEVIPQPYKRWFQNGVIVVQSGYVAHNISAGVRFNVRF